MLFIVFMMGKNYSEYSNVMIKIDIHCLAVKKILFRDYIIIKF